jgi:hypothetical protein
MSDKGTDQGGAGQSNSNEGGSGNAATIDKLELLVGGEKHEVSREDAIKYAQMGMDYTKKTQSLAAEREKFAEQVESRAQEIYRQALERSGQGEGGDGEALAKKDPELAKKLEALEQRVSQYDTNIKSREAEAQLDGILSNLRKTYPELTDEDETLIMIKFNKEANSEADPVALFDSFAKERTGVRSKSRQSIIDDYVKSKTRSPFSSGESGKTGGSGSQTPTPPKTFEEARERAEQRMRA